MRRGYEIAWAIDDMESAIERLRYAGYDDEFIQELEQKLDELAADHAEHVREAIRKSVEERRGNDKPNDETVL